ncbi:MAG TPA: hypothetical protein PLX49_03480 [Prolixibacteraceae bacterium]|nr:hypothetical protein [Prolixibacteraceae bacterium]HPJ79843.1 hypothetical protein [Prolixibacteraceae bacterium]
MRTVILFSSVFYLLGLKLGHTVDLLKRAAIPVRSVISAPALREDKPDRAYFFKKEGDERKKTETEKKVVSDSVRDAGTSAGTGNQVQSR